MLKLEEPHLKPTGKSFAKPNMHVTALHAK